MSDDSGCMMISIYPQMPYLPNKIPAGLVEEKALVWLFNAFENWNCSQYRKHGPAVLRIGEHTEGPTANLLKALEDIMKGMYPDRDERGDCNER